MTPEYPEDSIRIPKGGPGSEEGSFFLGIAVGFWTGCIGLALVYLLTKKKETRAGARWGFVAQIIAGGIARFFIFHHR